VLCCVWDLFGWEVVFAAGLGVYRVVVGGDVLGCVGFGAGI